MSQHAVEQLDFPILLEEAPVTAPRMSYDREPYAASSHD
jgi:hypothetical protein